MHPLHHTRGDRWEGLKDDTESDGSQRARASWEVRLNATPRVRVRVRGRGRGRVRLNATPRVRDTTHKDSSV